MDRYNTEPAIPSQVSASSTQPSSALTWQSSSSFGSTALEDRRADKFFDQIEDLLCEMMNDREQHRLHCRILEGYVHHEQPTQVFTAVVIVTAPVPKQ